MLQGSLVRVQIIETEMEAGVGREIKIRCEDRYFSVWVYNLFCTTNILFFCMNLSEGQSISFFQTYDHNERQANCRV